VEVLEMVESQIQSAIIDYLSILENQGKLFFQRTNNNTVYDPVGKRFRSLAKGQKKGFPDLLILFKGKCLGIEIKTITGRQSKEQKEIEQQFKKNGAEYYIVRSLKDVEKILRGE
jgi:hypothetical protein